MENYRQTGVQERESFLARGRRELSTPQGTLLFSAFLICGFLSIIIDIVGGRISIPNSVTYSSIAFINVTVLLIFALKIIGVNKSIKKKREDRYQQKFGVDYKKFVNSIPRGHFKGRSQKL